MASIMCAGPSELAQPGYPLRSAAFATVTYWSLVHVLHFLSNKEGLALITTLFVVHAIAADVQGTALDYTSPVAEVLLKVRKASVHGRLDLGERLKRIRKLRSIHSAGPLAVSFLLQFLTDGLKQASLGMSLA